MLAERPPLFFLAFLGLFLLMLTIVTMAVHGPGAVRSAAFALLVGIGAMLGLGEAFRAYVIARSGRRAGAGSGFADRMIAEERQRALRIATWGMLALAPVAGAALGLVWRIFQDLLW